MADQSPCSCSIAVASHRCPELVDPALLELRKQLRAALTARTLDFPTLEEVAARVIWLTGQPSSNTRQLAEVTKLDPEFASQLLRLANSALYASRLPISDLALAISRIGVEAVAAITIGSASHVAFRSSNDEYHTLLRCCWKKSAYAAAAGRLLAPYAPLKPELGFLAGLMHAIGEPLLVMATEHLIEMSQSPLPSAADLYLVIDPLTPIAGARLIDHWGLPAILGRAIACHRSPPTSGPADLQQLAALTHIAAGISCHCICTHDTRPVPNVPEFNTLLSVEYDDLRSIAAKTRWHGRDILSAYGGSQAGSSGSSSLCCPLGMRLRRTKPR